ncbi:MAG: hypothetical protein GC165_18400 [Armatimonadetes bacterium]|nr:hypothetical protein [Armatimonadota bacterium]
MSEPSQPPTPPPVFASYPRAGYAQQVYGTSEKLWRLFRGYHGMSYAFLALCLSILCLLGGVASSTPQGSLTALGVALMVAGIISYIGAFYLGARAGADIGYGQGWASGVGLFLGFISILLGLLVIAILQYLALGEIKRYGIAPRSFGGIKKRSVMEKIEELKAYESGSQPMAAPATS